jgi:nucleotide-binding universal stress UspA family protein
MMKEIVVATDGSEHALKAVEEAARLAAAMGAKLSVVAAAPSAAVLADELEGYARTEGILNDLPQLIASVEPPFLSESRSRALGAGATHVEAAVLHGDAASSIIDVARETGADLIVLGSRGRGRLGGLLLGSVSQKVATHAPCSVLVVR